ncbi:protein mono-ADP-ribosyltransferase PARP9 [Acanthopagrus latus]|uniref:protein mono-ADP-ribosyltransferase PARP9 n=1 Tax=Acanthopagrus latus TaxID=8177 RepID=UPI00187C5043|nr:protein mono-ADP-ribosyltransferase PARP9 [Acanthopagrus latus]
MLSKLDLHGHAVEIVRRCGAAALSDVIDSKFGCVATFDGADFAQQKKPTVIPEKRFEFTLPAGVTVSVWKADLTNCPVDAVVNAANEDLMHFGGLALALSKAGGPQIQKESQDHISAHGVVKTGNAVVTGAGSLPCKMIIHAVGPCLPAYASQSDLAQAEGLLRKTIYSILDRVKENNLNSVAIPAVSSGLFHYPLPQCADTIVSAVKHYYGYYSAHRLKEIRFVNHDEPTVKEMLRACQQILGSQQSMSYSQAAGGMSRGDAKTSTTTLQMGNVSLTLKWGQIEEQQTDVIVNTIGNKFDRKLNSGVVSSAILKKAGDKLQKEIVSAPATEYVIMTSGQRLRCKEVYHTFCPTKVMYASQAQEAAAQEFLLKSVLDCLWLAAGKGHKSIAFPAIGTGALGFSKKEVADIMSEAVTRFAKKSSKKMDVYFVIFPSDVDVFKAFEEKMRTFPQKPSYPSLTPGPEPEGRGDFHRSRGPTPQISLRGPSHEAEREAEQWLRGIFFESSGFYTICNNFILHFGEEEQSQLSRLMEKYSVSIEESFETSRASIIVQGKSAVDVAVAGLQVEAQLINIQKEFVKEEASAIFKMISQDVSFEKKALSDSSYEFSDRMSAFKHMLLRAAKVDRVENAALEKLFEHKKEQLGCFKPKTMYQRIPAQFIDMVSRVGFHTEFAPPDDPAYGEGIYFASSPKKAMDVWKGPKKGYLHFVEAEVLTGNSTLGQRDFILPPLVGKDSLKMYDSLSGPEISVIFNGHQALPKYIITCEV